MEAETYSTFPKVKELKSGKTKTQWLAPLIVEEWKEGRQEYSNKRATYFCEGCEAESIRRMFKGICLDKDKIQRLCQ